MAISFLIFMVVASVTITSVKNIGDFAQTTNSAFGKKAATASGDMLEIVGKEKLLDKAYNVAKEIRAYLASHPDIDSTIINQDLALANIAVQRFDKTGYTFFLEETQPSRMINNIVRFYPDPRFINSSVDTWSEEQFKWLIWYVDKDTLSGYYYWKNALGDTEYRFMYLVTLDGSPYIVPASQIQATLPGLDHRYLIAATIDVEELRALSHYVQDEIASESGRVTRYIHSQLESVQWFLEIMLITTLILAIILAYWLAKTVTKPISALTESAKVLAKGDFEHRVDIHSGGEIEELGEQFNLMASALKQSYAGLEQKVEERTRSERRRSEQLRAINKIGQKISSILSTDELLPYVVDSLHSAFNYNVHIFLKDPDSGDLVLKVGARRYDQPSPREFPMGEDENTVTYAARTGQPLMINDLKNGTRFTSRRATSSRSEIAVPIKAGSGILGVINMESDQVGAFDEIDLFTAETVADQLAIALTNVSLYQETRDMGILEERNRLAREIHDTLAQGFTGIVLQLEAAEDIMLGGNTDTKQVWYHLNRARQLARESLDEARRSVRALRPSGLEQFPITECLQKEVSDFIRDSGIKAHLIISGQARFLHPEIENTLLLVFRESLLNIQKHARAAHVEVSLTFHPHALELRIRDDGIGFITSTRKQDSFGLISMRERAILVGGFLTVESNPGIGTTVTTTIPFEKEKADAKN